MKAIFQVELHAANYLIYAQHNTQNHIFMQESLHQL